MDLATQNHLTTLRALLAYRRKELQGEIRAAESQRGSASAVSHEVTDRKDEAGEEQQSELDDAQQRRDIDELEQVEQALQRLDEGRYGACVDCGESIPLQRLLVQPAAQRCAVCQTAHEQPRERIRTI